MSRFKRIILLSAGVLCVFIGVIGIFLPIIPTTPLLLLASACFYRSSERAHQWLINHKWFGKVIRDYQNGQGISFKTKLFAVSVIWISIGMTAVVVLSTSYLRVILLTIATVVSLYILSLPTKSEFKHLDDPRGN
mgnify:FL=1